MKNIKFFIILILIPCSLSMYAQQEEVRVVKPYTPTLTDAEKIQLLPVVDDTLSYDHPEFEYEIFSKRYETDYRVTPIKPATMIQPALNKLYKSEIKLGAGNYLTPLAELKINKLRSSNGTFGALIRHHSMNGKVRLDNNQKVDAGFNENQFKLYGKRLNRKRIFEYEGGANYNSYVHYGVDTTFSDLVSRDLLTHGFFNGHAALGIQSAVPDSFRVQYNARLSYDFFTHEFDQMEHGAVLDGNVSGIVNDFRIGSDLGLSYYGHPGTWDPLLTNQFMIKINPYFSKSAPEWRFRVGINTYTEIRNGKVSPHFYVKGNFSFNIVEEVLVPYMGVDGFQETNSYMKITEENPYLVPGTAVTPTNHRIYTYLGLKGRITNYLAWNLRASYSVIDDQYFFTTDTTNILNNQFSILYDDLSRFNMHAELNIAPTESLRVFLKGNYYHYQLARAESSAWYMPDYDVSLQARYNLADKIFADAGFFVIGPRHFPSTDAQITNPGIIETTVDINAGIEYRYTKLLSFWAKFNNITAQPYYLWNNYPSYRFRFMLGFTYGL